MAANVETMFYTREKPWHGLGTMVAEAPTSESALRLAGLDWHVEQHAIMTAEGVPLDGYVANVRDTDKKVLGAGVTYETAGSLQEGKKVWLHVGFLKQKDIEKQGSCVIVKVREDTSPERTPNRSGLWINKHLKAQNWFLHGTRILQRAHLRRLRRWKRLNRAVMWKM